MHTLKEKIATELRVRQLLEAEELPSPDQVEYGHACIRLLWNESKVCLVVDLEGGEPDDLSDPYP